MPKHPNYSSLTKRWAERNGWMIGTVERWIAFHEKEDKKKKPDNKKPKRPRGQRVDLFGMIDYIAIREGMLIGVQSTSWAGAMKHAETAINATYTFDQWAKDRAGEVRYPLLEWMTVPSASYVILGWRKPGRFWRAHRLDIEIDGPLVHVIGPNLRKCADDDGKAPRETLRTFAAPWAEKQTT